MTLSFRLKVHFVVGSSISGKISLHIKSSKIKAGFKLGRSNSAISWYLSLTENYIN